MRKFLDIIRSLTMVYPFSINDDAEEDHSPAANFLFFSPHRFSLSSVARREQDNFIVSPTVLHIMEVR